MVTLAFVNCEERLVGRKSEVLHIVLDSTPCVTSLLSSSSEGGWNVARCLYSVTVAKFRKEDTSVPAGIAGAKTAALTGWIKVCAAVQYVTQAFHQCWHLADRSINITCDIIRRMSGTPVGFLCELLECEH